MSLLSDLKTVLTPIGVPVETGVFSGKAPEQYLVLVPLVDTFNLAADNKPGVCAGGTAFPLLQRKLYGKEECHRAGIAFIGYYHNRTAIHRL